MQLISYGPIVWSSYVCALDIQDNFLYAVYSGRGDEGLMILDISDPSEPEEISRLYIDNYFWDLKVRDDYAYIFSSQFFQVFDVSDPEEPAMVGQIELEFLSWDYTDYTIEVSGNLIYASCHLDGFMVFDVSDPENPFVTAYYDTPGVAHDLAVIDDLVYVADETSLGVYRNTMVGLPDRETIPFPGNYEIVSIYPNPFNSTTTIQYSLPVASPVSLNVYNINGQLVKVLVNRYMQSGKHRIVWEAENVVSGVYFIKIENGWKNDIVKTVLLP